MLENHENKSETPKVYGRRARREGLSLEEFHAKNNTPELKYDIQQTSVENEPKIVKEENINPVNSNFSNPIQPKQQKAKNISKKFLIVFLSIILVISLSGVYIWSEYKDQIQEKFFPETLDYSGPGEGKVLVSVPEGATGTDIAYMLFSKGVIKTPEAFLNEINSAPIEPKFFPGSFYLKEKMNAKDALVTLTDPNIVDEISFTIPEGKTAQDSFKIISKETGIDIKEFESAAENYIDFGIPEDSPNIEGWVFPATYDFSSQDTAETIISTMVNRTEISLEDAQVTVGDENKILTIASIIQREARSEEDFYKVSRVIHNRLEQGMKLEMDSTVKYGAPNSDSSVWTTSEQRADENPYNTYFVPGLPVGPISNPGDLAIDAAQNPVEGDWLFFVTTNQSTGETVFAENYNEHLENVDIARKWCQKNPNESGC